MAYVGEYDRSPAPSGELEAVNEVMAPIGEPAPASEPKNEGQRPTGMPSRQVPVESSQHAAASDSAAASTWPGFRAGGDYMQATPGARQGSDVIPASSRKGGSRRAMQRHVRKY